MNASRVVMRAVGLRSWPRPGFESRAADADDIAELKRAIEALREENRALAKRLNTLEAEKAERERERDPGAPPAPVGSAQQEELERRVKELEAAKTAQEDATRSIIEQSLSKIGPKINEVLSLGGTLEVTPQWTKDFSAETNAITLSSATLEFDIQATPWAFGRLNVAFNEGTNVLFPTTTGYNTGVDRFTLDLGYITLGDTQRFPPYLTAGKLVLPFGVSTGHPVTDTLSINSPLTVEVFETRQTAVGFGLAFPTPDADAGHTAGDRPTGEAAGARACLQLDRPWTSVTSHCQCGRSRRLRSLSRPRRPPFDAGIYFYDSQIPGATQNAARRHGGLPHEGALWSSLRRAAWVRPLSLGGQCRCQLEQLDLRLAVPARRVCRRSCTRSARCQGWLRVSKRALGPFSVVGEWNGATRRAQFVNGLGVPVSIKPSAWQVSLAYQFDWNPWVLEIGQQGTFVSIAYSQSSNLAGTTALINGAPTRVGFVPKSRLLLTAGEWVLDTVRRGDRVRRQSRTTRKARAAPATRRRGSSSRSLTRSSREAPAL